MSINQSVPPSFNLPEPVDLPPAAPSQDTSALGASVPAVTTASPEVSAVTQTQYGDELSQQWIHAVEGAIRQGIDDPRVLSAHIDELRAQYISGRYAKEVKRQTGKGK
jgi:hypothetical protein